MKKSAKIITATLAAITVLFAAMAITVSADTETNSDIIISQNVAYTGDFALMYAVDPAKVTAPVTLNIYEAEPTEASTAKYTFTSSATTPAATSGLDIDAYIFIANGTAAKDMTKVYYAQVVDANGVKSEVKRYSVAEYLYERLATPDITEKQEALYESVITFGDKAIDLLAAGNPLVSAYKYVTIEGGTLDGTYDAGIYLKNDTVNPQAEGVTSWTASDGTKVANGESYTIGDNHVSFTETVEEPAVDTITIDRTRTGTNTLEGYALDSYSCYSGSTSKKFGWSAGFTTDGNSGIKEDTVYGTTSQVVLLDPTAGGDLSCYVDSLCKSDVTADEATAYEISADIKFVPDSSAQTYQHIIIRSSGNKTVFNIKVFMNTNGDLYFVNVNNSEESYTFTGGVSSYNHICFRFTGAAGSLSAKLYINGTYACTFKTEDASVAGTLAYADMSYLRITYAGSNLDSKTYIDNIYQGLVK
ncbi:MAG: hypothetical protein J6B48_08430 [Clostridia bacterium]|nr:hypothetical protein [Clostridia bacterium]